MNRLWGIQYCCRYAYSNSVPKRWDMVGRKILLVRNIVLGLHCLATEGTIERERGGSAWLPTTCLLSSKVIYSINYNNSTELNTLRTSYAILQVWLWFAHTECICTQRQYIDTCTYIKRKLAVWKLI